MKHPVLNKARPEYTPSYDSSKVYTHMNRLKMHSEIIKTAPITSQDNAHEATDVEQATSNASPDISIANS